MSAILADRDAVRSPDSVEPIATPEVAIVGAGFGGIGAAAELHRAGFSDVLLVERAGSVGGVWRDNTYPGARCDVPSVLYSFSFAQRSDWSDHYASQPEILDYLRDYVNELKLADKVLLNTDVSHTAWDEASGRWKIDTSRGLISARMLIVATGSLNEPTIPRFPGLSDYTGELFHSSRWPADFDPTDKRIAVIGTGASGVQLVPEIAEGAAKLTIFQRTPAWVLPRGDRVLGTGRRIVYRRIPGAQWLARTLEFGRKELLTETFVNSGSFLNVIERIGRRHLAGQVKDRGLRSMLTPTYRAGCKRIVFSDRWYPTLCRPNVILETDAIAHFDATGIATQETAGGTTHRAFDAVILATGFQVTRLPFLFKIAGRDGQTLAQLWGKTGPSAYLGSTVAGFPNMVLMTGPNTGLGAGSMVLMIESQARYACELAKQLRANPTVALDVRQSVQDRYTASLQERLAGSVWATGGCQSWYQDHRGNVTTMWPGRVSTFRRMTRSLRLADYEQIPVR